MKDSLDEGAGVVRGAEQGRGQEGAQAGANEGCHLQWVVGERRVGRGLVRGGRLVRIYCR